MERKVHQRGVIGTSPYNYNSVFKTLSREDITTKTLKKKVEIPGVGRYHPRFNYLQKHLPDLSL